MATSGGIIQFPSKVAGTPNAGVALVNGTPTILTYTTPNDGNQHTIIIAGSLVVAVLEVGGQVNVNYVTGGVAGAHQLFAGAQAAGNFQPSNAFSVVVDPNTVVSISQQSALTAGTATVFASFLEV